MSHEPPDHFADAVRGLLSNANDEISKLRVELALRPAHGPRCYACLVITNTGVYCPDCYEKEVGELHAKLSAARTALRNLRDVFEPVTANTRLDVLSPIQVLQMQAADAVLASSE